MKIGDLKIEDIRNGGPAYCHEANLLLIQYCRTSHNQTTLELLQEAVTKWPTDIPVDDEEFQQSLTQLEKLHDQQDLLENLIKANVEYLVRRYYSMLAAINSRSPLEGENMSGDEAVSNATIEIGSRDVEPEQFAMAKLRGRISEEGPETEMLNDGEYMFPNAITDVPAQIDFWGEYDEDMCCEI